MPIIYIQQYLGTDELFNKELLSSEIIRAFHSDENIILRTDDGFSSTENGLFKLLDNLCDFWGYDKSKITLETNNWGEAHNHYVIKPAEYAIDFLAFSKPYMPLPWNKEKAYGMFIGRRSAERVYSIVKHRRFKYADRGLTSFHQHLLYSSIDRTIALPAKLLKCTIADILDIAPYSDIDDVRAVPIVPPANTSEEVWKAAYEKIAIEIVCETTLCPTSFQVTEKTLRPIYSQRPFLILGSKDYLKKLNNIGFKTFDKIIPSYYDGFERFIRVDAIFDILENLIEENKLSEVLDACQSDIMHNYNLLLELSKKHIEIRNRLPTYYGK